MLLLMIRPAPQTTITNNIMIINKNAAVVQQNEATKNGVGPEAPASR